MDPAALRVLIALEIRKLILPSGIPNTLDELKKAVKGAYNITEDFSLQYKDSDFNDFFTLTSTDQIQHKDTIKVVFPAPIILTLFAENEENITASTSFSADEVSSISSTACSVDDAVPCESTSYGETVILSPQTTPERMPWPQEFPIPSFSPEIEILVKKAMEDYNRHGSLLNVQIVKKDVMDHLVKAIYMYTSYPSGKQIEGVAEALIRKYPCLKEPGSFTGFQGWQMSLKYKMADYRRRLSKFGFPEVLCNTFKKKNPEDRKSAKSVKKPRKAEVNYLPQYPPGENQDSLEQERVLLLTEVKKKNNTIVVKDKMSRTFALRRHEVIELCPSVAEIKDRWPALFDVLQINEEFRRITTLHLESIFMKMLDLYTPKLLAIFTSRGGALGWNLKQKMDALLMNPERNIDMTRDIVLRCLICYLGEKEDNLIQEYNCDNGDVQQDILEHIMKIAICKGDHQEDISIILEGVQVMTGLGNMARACAVLLGLTYALNLTYPKKLKNTFEAFQKLLLELDVCKLSGKLLSLKNKLLMT
ncbi:uncharacterized protein LOC130426631 [Triplophysa dalaica]|uniref:uncharacterized protein LOC130413537 n=1 Tax=Triplophysa dalaica TaxID=1582913 RepID=UPI0024DF7486|nr:uncharacterized protein LOC130413537 [Triplophysa dalaica]XP_056594795.1 uncharacterized protein LOC130413537 [Triplophysa dalaica]XP_056594796.1 uncharacterized protein LOC130413537 [Triplophysa dalaica]XP_056609482.1 uncharacterized protein LOC130426631 [Triplophysa dalaica]XP_056609483.1 uncharacterized protein LOC130426631 [Triplophysa dalaica]